MSEGETTADSTPTGSSEQTSAATTSEQEYSPEVVQKILKAQKFTPKVDGEVLEVDLDELLRGYSHGRAASKRMQDATRMSKEAEQTRSAIEQAKGGDIRAFKHLFGDDAARSLSEQLLLGHIEWEQLPEAERRARVAEQRLAEIEEKEAEDRTKQEQRELETAKAQALQEIDQEFGDALKKLGRKPTPRLLLRMAEDQVAYLSGDSRDKPMAADRVLKKVLGELETDLTEYMADADAETLLRVMPESAVKALRKHFAEAARSQDPLRSGRPQPTDASNSRQTSPSHRKNSKDWWTEKERRYGSKT